MSRCRASKLRSGNPDGDQQRIANGRDLSGPGRRSGVALSVRLGAADKRRDRGES